MRIAIWSAALFAIASAEMNATKPVYHNFMETLIIGPNPVMLKITTDKADSYEDAGATCIDSKGFKDTTFVQTAGDTVDMAKAGVYSIMYRCPGSIWKERTVVVSKKGCSTIDVAMGEFSISKYVLGAKSYKGRPVYMHAANGNVMFYEGNDEFGMWATGPTIGSAKGMRVTDPAPTPDDVTETWEMWSGDRDVWLSIPEMKTQCADKIPDGFCENIAMKLCGKWMVGGNFYHKASCLECVMQKEPELKAGGCKLAPKQMCSDFANDGHILLDQNNKANVHSGALGQTDLTKDQKSIIGKMCILTDWNDWSPCSRTCGVASKSRKRLVVTKGDICLPLTQTAPCDNSPCPWIPGVSCVKGTQYGAWSECSHICGPGGTVRRYKRVTRCLALNQFKPLSSKLLQTKPCAGSYKNCTGKNTYAGNYESITPYIPSVSNSSKTFGKKKVDPKQPIIKIIGSNPIMIKKNQLNIFQDPGATCWSPWHTNKVKWGVNATGKVDMSMVGTYTITYSCYDAVPRTRVVKVTEKGCSSMEVNMGVFSAGVFTNTGKVHDGRPVYNDKNSSVLYYHGNEKWGEWAISHKLGDKQKLVKVEDPAIVPDDVVGTWHMWNANKKFWTAMPDMMIHCAANEDFKHTAFGEAP